MTKRRARARERAERRGAERGLPDLEVFLRAVRSCVGLAILPFCTARGARHFRQKSPSWPEVSRWPRVFVATNTGSLEAYVQPADSLSRPRRSSGK